ncbi:putative TATA element modulatory factor 1 TATA binding domain-containing protein [Seiridium cardinale]|uniref:TATA element modulatory factor 1 TATA binding domain-containing protein n=1 Tax=Seiridium cardinale TaxID=138064 RepID=A0ABR2Y3T1_9PEZI
MSAPSKGSRWGSLLSQAVAGVEARLDNILAEEEPAPKQPPSRPASAASVSRSASTSGKTAGDRLQERLARAVAAKNAASAGAPRSEASPARQSTELSSANRSPRPSSDLARADSPASAAAPSPRTSLSKDEQPSAATEIVGNGGEKRVQDIPSAVNGGLQLGDSARPSTQDDRPYTPEPAALVITGPPSTKEETVPVSLLTSEKIVSSLDLYEKRIAELEKTLEETQVQHQEELHSQVEQVDALQAKLQYLAREASEAARKDVSAAAAGSLEKKVAEKDLQVAQLMEEGNKLAGNEQKLRAVIKKLRTQITADEKDSNEQKIWRQKAEIELVNLRDAVRGIDDHRKASDELQKTVTQLKRDLDRSRTTISSKDATISDLKAQLREESDRARAMAAKVNDQAREDNQRKVKELEDTIAAMQVEKSLAADKAKITANELREKAERAAERTRAVELELKGEVQILESKLEALRATAEEASSGAVGDAQAKLLRQIETLQTQYSIASENWQGMEASLLARTASLEKERDEALRRESEMRRKARESAARVKRQEEELEEAKTQLPSVQRDLSDHQAQLELFRKRAEEAEKALAETKADMEKQRSIVRQDSMDRPGVERRPWIDEVAFQSNSRPASPLLSAPQRTYSSDFLGLQSFPTKLRKASAPSSNGDPSSSERPLSARRPSQQPRPSIFSIPSAQSGGTPPSILGGLEQITSPTHPLDKEDAFDSTETPASPHNVLQDMVSVSTIAAGPSVQLVERMSAGIRRLESEKVAAKEELARITSQRDEARGEIVTLMKEVEMGKSANTKVEALEKEVAQLNDRYQTTLEMLGEKSELVEELRADVGDVKAMYRDLVERTHK